MSELRSLMQPCDAARPTVLGSFVPWRAIGPSCDHSGRTVECAEIPSAATPSGSPASAMRQRSLTKNRPVGVGVAGAPIPTGAENARSPDLYRASRRRERSITIRVSTGKTWTAQGRTHPVVPFGIPETCTRSQDGRQRVPRASRTAKNVGYRFLSRRE